MYTTGVKVVLIVVISCVAVIVNSETLPFDVNYGRRTSSSRMLSTAVFPARFRDVRQYYYWASRPTSYWMKIGTHSTKEILLTTEAIIKCLYMKRSV